jgi:hypothetical protein
MTAIITITVLAGVVALRSATAGKVEITLNDAIIAAIAAVLALLVSGKLSKVVVGSEGVTIETARDAILSSAAKPIAVAPQLVGERKTKWRPSSAPGCRMRT